MILKRSATSRNIMKKEHSGRVKSNPDLSVVVLCYREEEAVRSFVSSMRDSLNASGVSYEVILVANYKLGKTDRTPAIARELAQADPHLVVISEPKRGMYGWDVRRGLLA